MKKYISLLLCFILLLFTTACSNNSYSLNIEINEMPKNIDPQLASTESELMIVRNTFEGLMRFDSNNKLVNGAAEKYEILPNGKEYTFYLRKNLLWSDDTKLTADDFVFAIERASDPETNSPFVDYLRNINGVTDLLKNKSGKIGVTAINSTTVKFTLNQPDEQFLEKLTLAVFMPCNRSFFESCKGKYGLDKTKILSNGNYYVNTWDKNNKSVKIASSSTYNGNFKTGPSFVWLNVANEDEKATKIKRLANGSTNLSALNYYEAEKCKAESVNITSIYNSTYSIIFNNNTTVASNNNLVNALSYSINKSRLQASLPANFEITNSVVPSVCKVGKTEAGKIFVHKSNYNSTKARELFLSSLQSFNNSTFPTFSILCEDDPIIKAILTSVISYWQQDLGAYVKIEVMPKDELLTTVQTSNYTAAFIPITAKNESAYEYLTSFKTNYSQNIINFKSYTFDSLVTENNKNSASTLKKAENILLNHGNIIPICEAPTNYGSSKDIGNLCFSLFNGITDFAFVTKE